MTKSSLPPREQIYSSLSWGAGSFPYLDEQIFKEKEDIDIAFMGSSRMWWGIDTPQVEAQLSAKLGRKTVVRSLCWNSPGTDPFYFILRDLLEHRKVRMIVFTDCITGAGNEAHPRAPYFFRIADDAADINDLSLRSKLSFYTSTILGAPRNALGMLRANDPVIPSDEISWEGRGIVVTNVINPFLRLGSLAVRMNSDRPFVHFTPTTTVHADSSSVYSESTRQNFHFANAPVPQMQAAFLKKIGALAQQHGVKLVYLHMPQMTEPKNDVTEELYLWPELLGQPVTMIGISPMKLFGTMTDGDEWKLFNNYEHFNQNGQEYFTSAVAPVIAQLYEEQNKR